MKKTLSLILAALLLFSIGAMSVSAADEELVTVKFVVDDQVVYEIQTLPGEIFVDRLQQGDQKLETPVKPSTETTEYIFKYWECKEKGITATTGNIPAAYEDLTYVAVFVEEDIKENQSFFKFLESIFARINMIFEYFAKVFQGVFDF